MVEWTLHRQPKDVIADYEFSIWCDGEAVVLANVMPGEEGVLATIVKAVNNHESLVKALEDISKTDGYHDAADCRVISNAALRALVGTPK